MRNEKGFTLIELVVVIVILGILAVAATAKFQDLTAEARAAAIQGVAGELASASAINFAKVAAGGTGVTVDDCTNATLNSLTQQGTAFGSRYTSTDTDTCANLGDSLVCTFNDTADTAVTVDVTLICAP